MTRAIASPVVRAAVVVLTVAVVLCVMIPMGGGDAMHLALACCLVLGIAIRLILLRCPSNTLSFCDASRSAAPVARAPTGIARAPDIFALGSLLT